ncbi:MAG: 3'(2'),5'-bisphosphate nucleotidase [Planctomycetes bacterium]|nr:3'(2'),5'-bisphosphate nucleotidase [Planctomycetota bacterium]
MSDFATELQTALSAVRQASQLCRAVQTTITSEVLDKRDQSPVTIADFGSQAVVCRSLNNVFPNDPIIAEEDSAALRSPENAAFLSSVCDHVRHLGIQADASQVCAWIDHGGATEYSNRFWTLDPIDGTKGFLRKGQYAVSLALIVDSRIEVGVLGCPNLPVTDAEGSPVGTLFYAVRGHGAFVLPLDMEATPQAIRVSSTTDSALARFCESVESGHSSHHESASVAKRLGLTATPVRMDSQAKYATVARGFADAYLRLPTKTGYFEKIWDHAGGVAVVEEAGGRVSDINGKPLDFSRGRELNQNRGVIVTNGHLHDTIVAAVQAVMASESAANQ